MKMDEIAVDADNLDEVRATLPARDQAAELEGEPGAEPLTRPPIPCATCARPVSQRDPQVRTAGKRWHRDCWPGGRPARAGVAANRELRVRVTESELDRYEQAAGQRSLSEWVRATLDAAAERKAS
jgi:hypothetical protein